MRANIGRFLLRCCLLLGLVVFISSPAMAGNTLLVAGAAHTVALKTDGTAWAWGGNPNGQLGDGSTTNRITPVPVAGLLNIVALTAGENHTLALRSDGTVWAWGKNNYGQLGDGSTTDRQRPVQVAGLNGVTALAAGSDHSLALLNDGTLMSWGRNNYGQLGDGTNANRAVAGIAGLITTVYSMVAGRDHTLAMKADGSVWAWGRNQLGQLGDGTTTNRLFPVRIDPYGVIGLTPALAIQAGADASYALKTDGTVWSWGSDLNYQLGIRPANSATYSATPLQLPGLGGITKIAAGNAHGAALKSDGTLVVWGSNANGQAGTGTPGTPLSVATPTLVANVANVAAIAAGGAHTVVLKIDQTLQAWGFNAYGQLGTRNLADSATPSAVLASAADNSLFNLASGSTPQNGWWWNPLENGRGFAIEQNGTHLYFSAYLYETTGRATWYVASGPMTGSSVYQAPLLAFAGGQTLTGAYKPVSATPSPGTVTLQFIDATHATLSWPGGVVPIERFDIVSNGHNAPPGASQPETGWWWNAAEGGRGFALEIQNDTLFVGAYLYDDNGAPLWLISQGRMATTTSYQGNWTQYGNGQTMSGAYTAPTVVNSNVGALTIRFSDAQNGVLTLPDQRQIPINRFRF